MNRIEDFPRGKTWTLEVNGFLVVALISQEANLYLNVYAPDGEGGVRFIKTIHALPSDQYFFPVLTKISKGDVFSTSDEQNWGIKAIKSYREHIK